MTSTALRKRRLVNCPACAVRAGQSKTVCAVRWMRPSKRTMRLCAWDTLPLRRTYFSGWRFNRSRRTTLRMAAWPPGAGNFSWLCPSRSGRFMGDDCLSHTAQATGPLRALSPGLYAAIVNVLRRRGSARMSAWTSRPIATARMNGLKACVFPLSVRQRLGTRPYIVCLQL